MRYYFAYGSNLHPLRLEERLGATEFYETGQLPSASLLFNKAARDGSGKASFQMNQSVTENVYGAVYRISDKQERLLNRFEALGRGYHKIDVNILLKDDTEVTCFTYQAMPAYTDPDTLPYRWYKQLVVLGATYLQFPQEYIRKLENVPAVDDPRNRRARKNQLLIQKMQLQKKPPSG